MNRRSRATVDGDDGPARQIAFHRRKKLLLKKAMELSVLCDCSVGLVVFGPDGSLVQFSDDGDMGKLLEQYAEACRKPHERYTNDDLLKEYADSGRYDDMSSLSIARKREVELGEAPGMTGGSVELVGPSGQSIHVEGIKPAGFMDDGNYPLSPGSEKAHRDITAQFDQWMEVLNMRDGTQQGGGGGAGLGAAALRHKKSLSVTVPEMPTGHVFRSADDGPHADGGAVSLRGGAGSMPFAGPLSINRLGSLGMSELMGMPSPGGLFFGGDGLFTSRGGLGLDLPTPDSTSNLPLNQAGFEWPTSSRDSMLPGFSDNESGEELPGGLMITGRGLRKRSATSPLRDGDDSPAAAATRGNDGQGKGAGTGNDGCRCTWPGPHGSDKMKLPGSGMHFGMTESLLKWG